MSCPRNGPQGQIGTLPGSSSWDGLCIHEGDDGERCRAVPPLREPPEGGWHGRADLDARRSLCEPHFQAWAERRRRWYEECHRLALLTCAVAGHKPHGQWCQECGIEGEMIGGLFFPLDPPRYLARV